MAVGTLLRSHVDDNVRACVERQATLESGDSRRLRQTVERMWVRLPEEYVWSRQWQHV